MTADGRRGPHGRTKAAWAVGLAVFFLVVVPATNATTDFDDGSSRVLLDVSKNATQSRDRSQRAKDRMSRGGAGTGVKVTVTEGTGSAQANASTQTFTTVENVVDEVVKEAFEDVEGGGDVNATVIASARAIGEAVAKSLSEVGVGVKIEGQGVAEAKASAKGEALATATATAFVEAVAEVTNDNDDALAVVNVKSLSTEIATAVTQATAQAKTEGGEASATQKSYSEAVAKPIAEAFAEVFAAVSKGAALSESKGRGTSGAGNDVATATSVGSGSSVGNTSTTENLGDADAETQAAKPPSSPSPSPSPSPPPSPPPETKLQTLSVAEQSTPCSGPDCEQSDKKEEQQDGQKKEPDQDGAGSDKEVKESGRDGQQEESPTQLEGQSVAGGNGNGTREEESGRGQEGGAAVKDQGESESKTSPSAPRGRESLAQRISRIRGSEPPGVTRDSGDDDGSSIDSDALADAFKKDVMSKLESRKGRPARSPSPSPSPPPPSPPPKESAPPGDTKVDDAVPENKCTSFAKLVCCKRHLYEEGCACTRRGCVYERVAQKDGKTLAWRHTRTGQGCKC